MHLFLTLTVLAGVLVTAELDMARADTKNQVKNGLTVVVNDEGVISATGHVPYGFHIKLLRNRIPELDLSAGIIDDANGDPGEWGRALDALTIIIPRLRVGETWISDQQISISGTLQPGFNAETTRAAVRLALGSTWHVDLKIQEAPPPATLEFTKSATDFEIDGLLPAGIEPADAKALLERPQMDAISYDGLTGGGAGDAAAWRIAITELGEVASLYADANGQISGNVITIDGTLLPGYEPGPVGAWLKQQLDAGWEISVTGHLTPARDGDMRRNLATGETLHRRRGYWIAEKHFRPAPDVCTKHTNHALAGTKITFINGSSQINSNTGSLIDQLSGIAFRCLNEGGLKLVIGGHADAIGNDDDNLTLSLKRAVAVQLELIDRGVRADAMTAVGYGEARPIAENNTEDGRALNRRISLDWKH